MRIANVDVNGLRFDVLKVGVKEEDVSKFIEELRVLCSKYAGSMFSYSCVREYEALKTQRKSGGAEEKR